MAKTANRIYQTLPFGVTENGLNPKSLKVSESVFSLANEYMGVRGFFEEGTSIPSLIGSYFNGVYDYAKKINDTHYKGIISRTHFMVNSVNWLKVGITVDGEKINADGNNVGSFTRSLDFLSGLYTRSYSVKLKSGKTVTLEFKRFLSMTEYRFGYQQITVRCDKAAKLSIAFYADFDVVHWGKDRYFEVEKKHGENNLAVISARTLTTNRRVISAFEVEGTGRHKYSQGEFYVAQEFEAEIAANQKCEYTRKVYNFVNHDAPKQSEPETDFCLCQLKKGKDYSGALTLNEKYWQDFFSKSDIIIEGDPLNQQGIRFCIFQLQQTYQGIDPHNNIGAKGLTGEAYSGHTFWDTETYCLPYFLFNNPAAAKALLTYRCNTLPEARERAAMLDLKGACYPIATLNGHEGCDLWQHASLQPQPSTGVAYGLWHYEKVTGDTEFINSRALEVLIEISRYLYSRGGYDAKGRFGFFCVMGPDEFQMMVNHNAYTNYMAQRTFEYTLFALERAKKTAPDDYNRAVSGTKLENRELEDFKSAADKMLILYNEDTGLFEQHQGFFDLPHIDIHSIPDADFPLYHHWSYDRIYRNDIIKQPDVLMFMLLYNTRFTKEQKKANYDYYEPRCIHESSLSPSVHSVFAAELGMYGAAMEFFAFATRLDLDDYNRNTSEGLHSTSLAAAWLNIVYGFGGLRSDADTLILNPVLPAIWKGYEFNITCRGARINVKVQKDALTLTRSGGNPVELTVYGKKVLLKERLEIAIKS